MKQIAVRGARTHNLKNIDLDLPRDQLTVITGLSGSGKSSLAFDTLYAEGQRRYVESLSAYARQFLSVMDKPDVDHIDGLSPAISIEQKSTSHNPRSTVGTVTEIYDYLRLLFARVGEPRCPEHKVVLRAQTISQMVDATLSLPEGEAIMLLAPVVQDRKGEHLHLFQELLSKGFIRARINGLVVEISDAPALDKNKKHTIEVVVDRLRIKRQKADEDSSNIAQRLAESFETAVALSGGTARIAFMDNKPEHEALLMSALYACPHCGFSLPELEPRLFSFNNPAGACPECDGLGMSQFVDPELLITDETLSLNEGAVRGWDTRNKWYHHILKSVSAHFSIDMDCPWQSLPEAQREIILHGRRRERVTFDYMSDRGTRFRRKREFLGVVGMIERRYRDTESEAVRESLRSYFSTRACPSCQGTRLNASARNVVIDGSSLSEITAQSVESALSHLESMRLSGARREIADKILKEIQERLRFLVNVGLNYLTLDRSAESLSGGEAQRIRLASQIGAGLVGVVYILDEPSIGLHQRDNQRLLSTLTRLRDLGNTVLVVEHDEEAIRAADHIVDMGPGAGLHGGKVVACGTPSDLIACTSSITGDYLAGRRQISIPKRRAKVRQGKHIRIVGARGNNLKSIQATIPLGLLTCVTGVSGSGKSTLVNQTLGPALARSLGSKTVPPPAPHDHIEGLDALDKFIEVDQSPIGRTPRSNPATYTNLFTPIRELFAETSEARSRGYKPGRFSFNVRGGRCEACQGDGLIKVEMHFLPDLYVKCEACDGQRYNRETLSVTYKGKNIFEVLEMTVEEGLEFFSAIPSIARRLQTLMDVGLSYIHLGQSATTLSGGEAQRIKLSRELSKRGTGRCLYILDEPTTGLHFEDIAALLRVLHRLKEQGNTLVVIEHNLDVIKTADWIIDLGPEGGAGGGDLIAEGTPETVACNPRSHTGRYLAELLHMPGAA
ncbi:MAG: excinuclease ABC subunit UvrA [Gammaproteobacteria bacterium]|nr:excinuclease ABC subunit UvrA [Gammaproteobacteria bacterium]MCY4323518.1 excinuclease ABC subunit UvrA [Gammaproteobacteria bacterium]